MRSINELIGIIKGVNFDGVINDKEILRLQTWVEKNRNLAYDKKQMELINLVESIIEDHVVDSEERILLIERAEEFLLETDNSDGIIYELNGIVEGIVCDGEINTDEVSNLREWMQENGESLKENGKYTALFSVIDEVLSDGIISEEEQIEILEKLDEQIQKSQLVSKIEYLCDQVNARNNIGADLIDLLDNESAMEEIHRRAESQLLLSLSSYSSLCSNPEIIVISLVLIAMLNYDGNFYDSVRSTYTRAYSKYSEQKVEGLIRTILGRYKDINESASRDRIINVALENAIVPQAFLPAFFEFIFDIYKLNFEYNLSENLYDDFAFVFEGLRSSMLSQGDDVSLNVTQKTYKLIATTKQLISKNKSGLDAVIKLSIIIVKLIDKKYWNRDYKIVNPYLLKGFEVWEKQFNESGIRHIERVHSNSEFKSRWEPVFYKESSDNCIYLVPPIHKVKAQYDARSIAIVLCNDGKELYRDEECYIKEIFGGYQINSSRIKVNHPLGNLTYKLVTATETIYDSKSKLYRDYLVFDSEGRELHNGTDYEGTVFICHSKNTSLLADRISTAEQYCLSCKLVRNGDALKIDSDVFNFSSMIKPGIFGDLYEKCFVVKNTSKNRMNVYKSINALVFEAENTVKNFEIVINGKTHKLSDFSVRTTYRDSRTKYVVNPNIVNSGIYCVEVRKICNGKRELVLRSDVVVDTDLKYSATVSNGTCKLLMESDLSTTGSPLTIPVEDFYPEIFDFTYGNMEYTYLIPFDIGLYRIDDSPCCQCSTDMWIEDIKFDSLLSLFDSTCDGLSVYSDKGALLDDSIAIRDYGYFKKIAIGFVTSYRNGNKYVLLVFTSNGVKKHSIFCYFKSVLNTERTEIVFSDNPKSLRVTPIYYGKNKVFFEMRNKAGELVKQSHLLASGQTELIDDFESFAEYSFSFYEKPQKLMLHKNTLMYETKMSFYSKSDFTGRIFRLSEGYYEKYNRDKHVERKVYFSSVYLKIDQFIQTDTYIGQLYVKSNYSTWLFNKLNPVTVEICGEVVDDAVDVYITNRDGDGLLLDTENFRILNLLEDKRAPDIFIYSLSMKGIGYEKNESN